MIIKFTADKIDLSKKRIDGNRNVVMEVGEYEHEKLAPILTIPNDTNFKITIEYE